MERYDLRHLKDSFTDKMEELIEKSNIGEVSIFMFEIGDFTPIQKSYDLAVKSGCEVLNSVKYNEVDWTLVVKKQ